MDAVKVNLSERSYDICLEEGLLSRIGIELREQGLSGKILLVADENTAKLYSEQALESLRQGGFAVTLVVVPVGETSKSLVQAEQLYTAAIKAGLDRSSIVAALGGGVVGDLAGFVAATYLRGLKFVQIPTSLLAQVDSSVGGKVAVNHSLGKNLIGAFYQPQSVWIDPVVLTSLPKREFLSGLAEVIKYAAIADEDLYELLVTNASAVKNRDLAVLGQIIQQSCFIKADIVSKDERESSLRMLLNFGHTLGHAIESVSHYGYTHGEAVAIGMYGATLISASMGWCNDDAISKIRQILDVYELPFVAENCPKDQIIDFMKRDKKYVQGQMNWVLLRKIGQASICNAVPFHHVETMLKQVLAKA